MVGGDDLQVVIAQAAPQMLVMMLRSQRRRAHVLRALELVFGRAAQIVLTEEQILRTGLGIRRQAAIARLHHPLERALRRQVHDIDRHVRHLGQRDGAIGARRLGHFRPRERVIDRRRVAGRDRPLDEHVDRRPRLGVHANERAQLARAQHRAKDRLVVEHEHAGIGHEHLEAGDALFDDVAHLAEHARRHVGGDHVEAHSRPGPCLRPWRARCRAPLCSEPPFFWIAKSTIVVVPPCAAASVPDSKSSMELVPPNGISRCVCASMPPGMMYFPAASIVAIGLPQLGAGLGQRDDLAVLDPDIRDEGIARGHARPVLNQYAHGALKRPLPCRHRCPAGDRGRTATSAASLRSRSDRARRRPAHPGLRTPSPGSCRADRRNRTCHRTCRCSTAPRCRRD